MGEQCDFPPAVVGESLLCWVKAAAPTFHSQPYGLQFPGEYLLWPEQHHLALRSQLKSIYSELLKEVTDMQLLSLGFINMARRLHAADMD